MLEQYIVFGTLIMALVLFVQGRPRYDLVALMALMAVALTGVIQPEDAFKGFAQPAVVTVAAILILTRGLANAGIVDVLTDALDSVGDSPFLQVLSLTSLVALLSAFMNNVGALALLLPVSMRMAERTRVPASILLMPLAFGSLLGGMMTSIGTPPNLIIAGFRNDVKGVPFEIFDYTPVGLGVTIAGILFISLIGWRLIPRRRGAASSDSLLVIEEGYLAELRIPRTSSLAGKTIRELRQIVDAEFTVVASIHDDYRRNNPGADTVVQEGDILLVHADAEEVESLDGSMGLELVGSKDVSTRWLGPDGVILAEAVIKNTSPMVFRELPSINLRSRYGVNLLAVARQGSRVEQRLKRISFRPGDIILIQGTEEMIDEAAQAMGWLMLAKREPRMELDPHTPFLAVGIFGVAIAITSLGLLPAHLAFPAAAITMILTSLLTLRQAYEALDWPVLILLGALIPVGEALEVSGGARTIADQVTSLSGGAGAIGTMVLLMIVTMLLSNILNNAAAAVLLAPVALGVASSLGVSADPFLIAIAVSASSAFMTPIGHQSCTLVMGPGGYKFTDYWRLGLPLQVIVLVISVPLISIFWPL